MHSSISRPDHSFHALPFCGLRPSLVVISSGKFIISRSTILFVLVPSQPRDVTAELVNDAIVVTWKEPQDHNGILRRYKVSETYTKNELNLEIRKSMLRLDALEKTLSRCIGYTCSPSHCIHEISLT